MSVTRFTFALTFSLLLAASAVASIEPPKPDEKWVAVVADGFVVYSNASEREAARVATDLVRMREALGKLTRMTVRSPQPVYVFLFRDDRSFRPYLDAIVGRKETKFRGYFLTGPQGKFVLLNAAGSTPVTTAVYHELAHHFVSSTVGQLPSWLSEALAQYYETFRVRGDNIDLGVPIVPRVTQLRRGPLIPLAQLFASSASSEEYDEGDRVGIFYGQSWAILHYLLLGSEQHRPKVPMLIGLLREGKPPEEAFAKAFGLTFEQLEKELRNYIRRPSMPYMTYSLAELQIPPVAPALKIARAELLVALGRLLFSMNESTAVNAEAFVREAIAEDAQRAEAHALLASMLERQARHDEAGAAFEKAVTLGSNDPQVHLAYGSWMVRQIWSKGAPAEEPTPELLKARKALERATELDPSSARAFAELGSTYEMVGDPAGIPLLEKAVKLGAREPFVNVWLANLYRRAGRAQEADQLMKNVPELRHGIASRQMVVSKESAELQRAGELVQAGKTAEAIPILRAVSESTRSASMKKQVEEIIRGLEGAQQRNPQLDVVLAADEKTRQGKHAEAIRILDALLPEIVDPELKRLVQLKRETIARKVK